MLPATGEVAMTQPNPGDGGNAAPSNDQTTPPAPANGPAAPTFVQPTLPTSGQPDTSAEDQRAQELLAAAAKADDPDGQLGEGGKKALEAERARAKAAEKAAAEQARQLSDMEKQLKALQPAADMLTQLRRTFVPEDEKTDLEKLTDRLAAAERTTGEERLRRIQLEVIGDLKLGKEWVDFLRGDTYDDMKAYAEKLLALMPKPEPVPDPAGDQTTAGDPPEEKPKPKKAPAPKPDPSQGARGATQARPTSLGAAVQKAMSGGG